MIHTLCSLCLLTYHILDISFELVSLLLWQELVDYEPNACPIGFPHRVLIVIHMTVNPQHVEIDVDSEDWILRLHIQICLNGLPLDLIKKELRL